MKMGSSFNKAIFEDHIQAKITGWANKAKINRKNVDGGNKKTPSPPSPAPESTIDQGTEIEIQTISAPPNGQN